MEWASWVNFPGRGRGVLAEALGPSGNSRDTGRAHHASEAKMIGGVEDEGVTLTYTCFFLEAIARVDEKER